MADEKRGEVAQSGERPLPEGVHTPKEDFDRNREGLYGGRPEVRGAKTPPEK